MEGNWPHHEATLFKKLYYYSKYTRKEKEREKMDEQSNIDHVISDVVCDYLSLNWHYSSRREKREGKFRAGGKILGWKKYVTIAKDIRSRESISLIPLRQR